MYLEQTANIKHGDPGGPGVFQPRYYPRPVGEKYMEGMIHPLCRGIYFLSSPSMRSFTHSDSWLPESVVYMVREL